MDEKPYSGNEDLALATLGLGMVMIAMRAAGSHGWSFLLFTGACLCIFSCGRITINNRSNKPWRK